MKKITFILPVAALALLMFLPACSSNEKPEAGLQAPEVTQTEVPAASAKSEKEDDDADEDAKSISSMTAKEAKAATIQNLIKAYIGETTASAKYAAYSQKAKEAGMSQIALLFQATSTSEKIHANNHRSVLEDLGAAIPEVKPVYTVNYTRENLMDAIAGESYEIATMYPEFLSTANTADLPLALTSLNYAFRTEQRHKALYEKALAALQANQVNTLSSDYYVCPTCGNTYDAAPPKRCRVSMTSSERMQKISAV